MLYWCPKRVDCDQLCNFSHICKPKSVIWPCNKCGIINRIFFRIKNPSTAYTSHSSKCGLLDSTRICNNIGSNALGLSLYYVLYKFEYKSSFLLHIFWTKHRGDDALGFSRNNIKHFIINILQIFFPRRWLINSGGEYNGFW